MFINELISNVMPGTGLQNVGTGQQRAEKASNIWKDSIFENRTSSN